MFRVTVRKWYRDANNFYKYDYSNEIQYEIEHEKLSECMDDVMFLKENNDLAKFSRWEIVDVVDTSEEGSDANE